MHAAVFLSLLRTLLKCVSIRQFQVFMHSKVKQRDSSQMFPTRKNLENFKHASRTSSDFAILTNSEGHRQYISKLS